MTDDIIIPKGSAVVMKLATIFEPWGNPTLEGVLVVHDYKVKPLWLLGEKIIGPRFVDQKIVARGKIYQFFIEVTEPIVGSEVCYGRRPVKDVTVKYIGERPDVNDKTGQERWATIEFLGGKQKTVSYNSLMMKAPRLIPVHFDYYPYCWAAYPKRRVNLGQYLVGSYYLVKEIDGVLWATDPIFPRVLTHEEELIAMDPVNKERLLEKLKQDRARIDAEIEILERNNS